MAQTAQTLPRAATHAPFGMPRPTAMTQLDAAERLLVWAFRRWVLGWSQDDAAHWTATWTELTRQFGAAHGKDAAAAVAGLVDVLRWHARRPIHHHQPCCGCLGADELSMIVLVAACQHGHDTLAHTIAPWLVRSPAVPALIAAATRLADWLAAHDLRFPERAVPASPNAVEPNSRALS